MKVSDGRKTKGKIGQKNEKAKLDKEWNKVKNSSQIEETAELLYSIYTKPLDSQIFALIPPEHFHTCIQILILFSLCILFMLCIADFRSY